VTAREQIDRFYKGGIPDRAFDVFKGSLGFALELSARDYGVLWTPMSFFYASGGGSHAIRLSCSALVPDQIDEGVRRLAALIGDVRS